MWLKDNLRDLHSKPWLSHMKEFYGLTCHQNAQVVPVIFVYATCLQMVLHDLAMDIFKQIEDYGYIDPKHNIPDHSLLSWCIMCPDIDVNDKGTNTIQERITFTKWKLNNIHENFLQSEESTSVIDQAIRHLERSEATQEHVDSVYKLFCNTVKVEMTIKLDKKEIVINSGLSNKKRKVKKPWWNDNLTISWNNKCDADQSGESVKILTNQN